VSTEHYIRLIEFTSTMLYQSYRVSDSDEEEENTEDTKRHSCHDAHKRFQRCFNDLLELEHGNALFTKYEDAWKNLLTMIVQERYSYDMLIKGIAQLRSRLHQLQLQIHHEEQNSGADGSVLWKLKHSQKMHEWASSIMQTKVRTFQAISARM